MQFTCCFVHIHVWRTCILVIDTYSDTCVCYVFVCRLPPVPGQVVDVTTQPISDNAMEVFIPVQPVEVARGAIEKFMITIEPYEMGLRQETNIMNYTGVVTFINLREYMSLRPTHSMCCCIIIHV